MTQLFNIIAFIVAADKRVAVRSTNIVVAAASAEAADEAFKASPVFELVTHALPAVPAGSAVVMQGGFSDLGRGFKLPEGTVELRPVTVEKAEKTEKVIKVEKLDDSLYLIEDSVEVTREVSEEFVGFKVTDLNDKVRPFAKRDEAFSFAARLARKLEKLKAEATKGATPEATPAAEEVPADAPF